MSHRYILCVDFDGVLHSYSSGWKGAGVVSDPPVPGAIEWLDDVAEDERFEVCVYSSRSKETDGVMAMKAWLSDNGLRRLDRISFPTQKPAASMTIDDRAFCFEGSFPSPRWLLTFRPWNKR